MLPQSRTPAAETPAPPIFIVGCGASGTNLVSQILDSHSRIAVCRGAQYHLMFFAERRYYGDLGKGRHAARLIADFVEAARAHDIDAPSGDAILRELREPTFEGVLSSFLGLYGRAQGKARAGERSANTYHFLPQILDGFPDSPVVFTMRDPRDLALAHKKGFGFAVDTAAAAWNDAFRAWERASRPVHLLRYEHLVQRPEETLRGLCEFLGERFEPDMLRFHERTPEHFRTLKHHARLSRPLDATTVGTFRELSAPEIQLIERRCAAGMRAMGYEPVGGESTEWDEATPGRRSPLQRVSQRLRYYGWNRQRWRRGILHWKIVLRARARHFLGI